MEAVGQLTGGLAHDFNNLLAGISGALEMMRLRVDQGRIGDLARYSTMAEEAVNRAASLTHRLLAFSRRQTLDPRPTDVEHLVCGMEELISRTVGPEIDLRLDLSEASWPVRVDPHQLENALLNLCINARDAMAEGGSILISASGKTLSEADIEGQGVEPGDYVAIAVIDTGAGITPETLSRVFEPFFTTKPIGDGTGLGLSMIYGFARQSAGFVEIASKVGHGTTVTIFLPRHLGEAAPLPKRAKSALPAATVCGNILVVDDEASVRSLIADVVDEIGCKAIQAADAEQAIVEIESDKAFDMMVTDIGLPGEMNGRRLADAALKARPDLKVIFVTGYAEDALTTDGDLPANMAIITKPFAIGTLAARLREMLEQA